MGPLPRVEADLQVIGSYLARRDLPSLDPAEVRRDLDVLVLCGSGVLATVDVAATAFHDGVVSRILVTGGLGHSTPYLLDAIRSHASYAHVATEGRAEAAIIAEVLRRHLDVPAAAVSTEEQATNCGENAELSLRILARDDGCHSVLLVQDPTMQRRTHAAFDHHQRLLGTQVEVVSFAPFVPTGAAPWGHDRFLSLLLGEVRRLHDDADGYGPLGAGFLDHVDVPDDVLAAAERLGQAFPNLRSRRA